MIEEHNLCYILQLILQNFKKGIITLDEKLAIKRIINIVIYIEMLSLEGPQIMKVIDSYDKHQNTEILFNDFKKLCPKTKSDENTKERENTKEDKNSRKASINDSIKEENSKLEADKTDSSNIEIHISLETINSTDNDADEGV